MKLKLFLFSFLLLALVACGGETASPAVELPADEAAANVAAPLDLPATVDVQTVADVKERSDVLVLDVREQWEYDEGHIPGVTLLPMNEVPARLSEIPTDGTVIVTCRSGNRSGQVANYLRDQGYTNVHNMAGGILAWQDAGYTVER
jgi:rhodanese-related sulfurtransferase